MKVKVTITLEKENWTEFRAECIRRNMSASEAIDKYIRSQRLEWNKHEKQKEREKKS